MFHQYAICIVKFLIKKYLIIIVGNQISTIGIIGFIDFLQKRLFSLLEVSHQVNCIWVFNGAYEADHQTRDTQ
jgi:hypothetical protein